MNSNYSNFSKEELLKLLQNKDKELKSKKYGLVWDSEREPEQVVLDCENNLPVLKRLKTKEIKTDNSEDNILIEGDNYHALSVLNYTHKEKIDVIYIDPPYNTGNKDFIYNDKYIDKEDGYRHSKWLNFMEKRLKLAHNLLKKTGVIFISIDDNEIAQLKLLCDKIFGEENFLNQIVWHRKRGKDNSAKFFSRVHEYVLVYSKDSFKAKIYKIGLDEKTKSAYTNPDNDSRGPYRKLGVWARGIQGGSKYSFKSKEGKTFSERLWLVNKETMKRYEKECRLYFVGDKVYRKLFLSEHKGAISETIWLDASNAANASDEIKSFFGSQIFETPKPIPLIKKILQTSVKKDSIILDFMAGSGTTGHAVLDLNKEDGGNRKFILCTNNENNICTDVTYPRLQKVIKGYKKNGDGEKVDGLNGNLQYLKTSLIKSSKNKEQLKINLTRECTEMICLKENIFNLKKEKEDYKIFESNKKDEFLCVYYNFMNESFGEFLKEVGKLKGKKKIYMFSLDGIVNRELFKDIEDFKIEAIPQKILEIYRQLVKQNIPIKKDLLFLELNKARKLIFEDGEIEESPKRLRIALENVLKKIAQDNSIIIFDKNSEKRINQINEELKNNFIISQIEWEENKTYLTIGNQASHGNYDEYNLEQIKNFYKHIQNLINKFEL